MWEILVPSEFYCKPKNSLKKKKVLKNVYFMHLEI